MTKPKAERTKDLDDGFQSEELPEGWTRATVCDLTESVPNVDPKSEPDRDFGYIDISSIDNKDYRILSEKRFLGKNAPSRARRPVRPGDILFSNVRTYLRNIAIVPHDCTAQLCSTGFTLIRSNGAANPSYLFYYSLTDGFIAPLTEKQTGSNYPATCDRIVLSAPIDVAPLAEQKRIVAKVEALLTEVNRVRARLEKVPKILKAFRQSILAAACSGRLTADWRHDGDDGDELPSSWSWMRIEALLKPGGIFDGPFGSNLKTSDYRESGIRVIRLENVGWLRFVHEKETYIDEAKYRGLTKHTVGWGDIIFASFISGEIRACVLPKLNTKAIAKADCFCLRPREDLIIRKYLVYQLVCRESYIGLLQDIHGATRPRINTSQLRALEVRLCPLKEQHEIVSRVEAMFKLADKIENQVESATKRAEKITQAILAKAFRGELVPTEAELARRESRLYESASVLLERIKSEPKTKGSNATDRPRRSAWKQLPG